MKKSLVKLAALSSAAFVLAGTVAPVVLAEDATAVAGQAAKELDFAEGKEILDVVNPMVQNVNDAKAALKTAQENLAKEVAKKGEVDKAALQTAKDELQDAQIELERATRGEAAKKEAAEKALAEYNKKQEAVKAAEAAKEEAKKADDAAQEALNAFDEKVADLDETAKLAVEGYKAAKDAKDATAAALARATANYDALNQDLGQKPAEYVEDSNIATLRQNVAKAQDKVKHIEDFGSEQVGKDVATAKEAERKAALKLKGEIIKLQTELKKHENVTFKYASQAEQYKKALEVAGTPAPEVTPDDNEPGEETPGKERTFTVKIHFNKADEPKETKEIKATSKADALAKVKAMYPGKEVTDLDMGGENVLTVNVEDKKDDKKPSNPTTPEVKDETPITDKAFDTEAAAKEAAEKHLKTDKVNKSFAIVKRDGKFYIQLSTEEKVEATKEVETTVDPLLAGYKTAEDAIKAAEALLEKMPWNNGYDIQEGADKLFYIRLTTDGTKTVNRKAVEATKEAKKEDKKEKLPETGEATSYAIFGAAALSVLAGIGLVAPKFKEEK